MAPIAIEITEIGPIMYIGCQGSANAIDAMPAHWMRSMMSPIVAEATRITPTSPASVPLCMSEMMPYCSVLYLPREVGEACQGNVSFGGRLSPRL